jgi:hypothetical protein
MAATADSASSAFTATVAQRNIRLIEAPRFTQENPAAYFLAKNWQKSNKQICDAIYLF